MTAFDNWLGTMKLAHGEVLFDNITEQGVREISFEDGYSTTLDVFDYAEPAVDIKEAEVDVVPELAMGSNYAERDARELRLIAIEIASRVNDTKEDVVSRAHRIAHWLEYGEQTEQGTGDPTGEPEPALGDAAEPESD